MRISITDTLVRNRLLEGSVATFTANFYDDSDSWTLTAPTSAKYRIDSVDTGEEIVGWTTLTPATSISITPAVQSLRDQCLDEEARRLTVRANEGLSTQTQQVHAFTLVNQFGTP